MPGDAYLLHLLVPDSPSRLSPCPPWLYICSWRPSPHSPHVLSYPPSPHKGSLTMYPEAQPGVMGLPLEYQLAPSVAPRPLRFANSVMLVSSMKGTSAVQRLRRGAHPVLHIATATLTITQPLPIHYMTLKGFFHDFHSSWWPALLCHVLPGDLLISSLHLSLGFCASLVRHDVYLFFFFYFLKNLWSSAA